MDMTEYTLRNSTVTWMVVLLLIGGGILSFLGLGRLEDPAFTIKQAMILTDYPGASALEVEEEITLPLEEALQQLPYIDNITSTSSDGMSQIQVEMRSIYRKHHLAQIWDEMRRKINDMSSRLPPGASAPRIIDDFGDVFGIFMAVTGDGYRDDELADYTDYLRRELVVVPGVSKVSVGGARTEQIFIEADRAKMAATGFSLADIQGLLRTQNLVSDAGNVRIGSESVRIHSRSDTGDGLASLAGMLVGRVDGQLVYLRDVATVSRGYADPPSHLYRYHGRLALGLGVSFATGVNVVEVGEAINTRLAELESQRPVGIEIGMIYNQPAAVAASVDDFLVSLAQAVGIVVLVLLFTMGLRPGILMSGVLLLTILGTFIVMGIYGIELHRISLGALIIALGMLVDNAIVITEGIMIGLQRGLTRIGGGDAHRPPHPLAAARRHHHRHHRLRAHRPVAGRQRRVHRQPVLGAADLAVVELGVRDHADALLLRADVQGTDHRAPTTTGSRPIPTAASSTGATGHCCTCACVFAGRRWP